MNLLILVLTASIVQQGLHICTNAGLAADRAVALVSARRYPVGSPSTPSTACRCDFVPTTTFFEEAARTGVIFTRGDDSRAVGPRADLTLGCGLITNRACLWV